jgi:hypothetical protein
MKCDLLIKSNQINEYYNFNLFYKRRKSRVQIYIIKEKNNY